LPLLTPQRTGHRSPHRPPLPPHSDRRRQRSCTALSSTLGIRYPTHHYSIAHSAHRSCLPLLDQIPLEYSTASLHYIISSVHYSPTPLGCGTLSHCCSQHLNTPQPINNSHAISQPAAANSTLSCLIEPEVLSAHRTFFHTCSSIPHTTTLLYSPTALCRNNNQHQATLTSALQRHGATAGSDAPTAALPICSTSLRRTRYCTTVHHKLTLAHFAPHPPCSGAFWKPSIAWKLFCRPTPNRPTNRARQGTACLPCYCDVRRARIARIPARILSLLVVFVPLWSSPAVATTAALLRVNSRSVTD
jgi:hypothetical protein